MASINVKAQLRERFSAPLEHWERRRIVVWHDADGEFAEDFAAIAADPTVVACEARALRTLDSREYGPFELKRLVLREGVGEDLLLYATWPLDLSGRALADDWLADVELYAGHFQADWLSLLVGEMSADGSAREGFRRFRAFFSAKARRQRFRRLVPHASTAADVALGVIACCVGAEGTGLAELAMALVRGLDREGSLPADLGKFGADVALAALLKARLGYDGSLDDVEGLVSTVALSALACTLPPGSLTPVSQIIADGHEEACLSLWREWQASADAVAIEEMARLVESEHGVARLVSKLSVYDLSQSDVLPCTGEAAITALMLSLSQGADRASEAIESATRMRDMAWVGLTSRFLDTLEAAGRMRAFQSRHAGGFHLSTARETWDAYVSDWSQMDALYRRLLTSADAAEVQHADAPTALRDALDEVCEWADGLYVNWYLRESNSCWVSCAQRQWRDVGHVRGIARQADFWNDVVQRELSGAKRVAVVVSDAMRYEVGSELAQRLSAGTKAVVETGSMQAAFPSVTEFGMASLLPHARLELRPEETKYPLADGTPTNGTDNRERVIRTAEPRSRAVQARSFMKLKRVARRELVGDVRVLYVYHDLIDSTGEEYPTEDRVLGACDETVDGLVALVKVLVNDLRFNRVVVTADHGFLYTRSPLSEAQKVSLAEVGADVAFAGRRHAVTTEPPQWPFLQVALEYDGKRKLWGAAPRECVRIARPGSGELYVHGGVSLQELCVPVVTVHFSDNRSKARTEPEHATLTLLSTERRVRSALFRVELWQREAVGGKVLPAEYDMVLESDDGTAVTDVRRASAKSESTDDQARVTKVQFALKPGVDYSSRKPYWLVCRDAKGHESWREEFRIEVAIAPVDDFGF